MTFLCVSIGGFLGAICRYWVSQRLNSGRFPHGTLTVNLIGSFLLGCLVGGSMSREWMLLLGVGFMGAFTTFSTLHGECVQYYQNKEWRKMGIYLGVTYFLGIACAWIGYWIGY